MEFLNKSTPNIVLKTYKKTSRSMEDLNYSYKFENFDFLSDSLERFHNENKSSFFAEKRLSFSDSSIDVCYIYDSDSTRNSDSFCNKNETCDVLEHENEVKYGYRDSGFDDGKDYLAVLELKIDELSEVVRSQGRLLSTIQEEMHSKHDDILDVVHSYISKISRNTNATVMDKLILTEDPVLFEGSAAAGVAASKTVKSGAKALLDALEAQRQTAIIDESIKATLANFLQSNELRESILSATTSSLKGVISQCLREDVTSAYLGLVRRSHRQMSQQLCAALRAACGHSLECHARQFTMASYRSSRMMRSALERHQRLLDYTMMRLQHHRVIPTLKFTVTRVLKNELKQWREGMIESLNGEASEPPTLAAPTLVSVPISPQQPAETGKSAIDLMMSAAEINTRMRVGDVNGSFERALSAADLSLVMAACRAADPDDIFSSPCRLAQSVLLSLLQQLATDMVHETQLKCRYIEDALISLDVTNPTTSKHLASVLPEVCNNLSTFIRKYPSHVCGRRIKMAVMAAGTLLSSQELLSAENTVARLAKRKIIVKPIYDS